MTLQIFVNAIIAAGPIGLVALGLTLVFSVTKIFHLAHAVVFSVSAYAAFGLLNNFGLPVVAGLVISVLVGSVLGIGIDICVYRQLRHVSASPLVSLVASLGIVIVGQNLLSLFFGDQTLSLRSSEVMIGYAFLGARITNVQIITVLLSSAICVVVVAGLRGTRVGQQMRAVASDSDLATTVGIPCDYVISVAFALASLTAALASLLVAYDTDLSPMMGFNMLLIALVAAITGGMGSIHGALLGALIVSLVQQMAGWFLPIQWQDPIVFSVLILFLLVRPQGFFGTSIRKAAV